MRLLAALVVAAVAIPAATAAPQIGGFGVRPAHFDPKVPATRAYFIHSVKPGGKFQDQIAVTSSDRQPLELYVYPVDGLTGETSGAVYGNRGGRVTETGRWLTPKVTHLTVPPRKTVLVPFTVAVPRGARPGDHLAGIAFQRADAGKSKGTFSVTQVLRAVVGVLIRVPGKAAFQPHLSSLGLKSVAGTNVASVLVGLGDAGRKLGKTKLTVALKGPDGYAKTVGRRLDTILPGDHIRYPLVWPDTLAPGTYSVTATATGGAQAVSFHSRVALGRKLTGAVTTAPAPAVATTHTGLPWWTLIAALAAGVLLAFGYTRVRSHRPANE